MNSAVASFFGLVATGIALYGFYWVIRLAVRDGVLEADRRRARGVGPAGPADPADAAVPPGAVVPPPVVVPPAAVAPPVAHQRTAGTE